jgi:hypothetical protein
MVQRGPSAPDFAPVFNIVNDQRADMDQFHDLGTRVTTALN